MASSMVMMKDLRIIDPNIWKSCAGSFVQIPAIDSRVYYFPQGHAEQSSYPPDFSSILCIKPYVLCRVVSMWFLANQDTDEVFVKIRLQPIDRFHVGDVVSSLAAPLDLEGDSNGGENNIIYFAKILTPSDANNGGGFSVPRFCADSIFPPLNYKAEPPVQMISVRDVHGVVWEFRHIYRGTPRRHLLTTGWSKFVNHKKLIAGDSVVFMKNRNGILFVGIRRTGRSSGGTDCGRWNNQYAAAPPKVKLEEGFGRGEIFSRNGRGRISAESVMEAAELSGNYKPFEVAYYPRPDSPEFVVKAETVEDSLNTYWAPGMRIKMAMETEDSARMTWFQGTVSSAALPEHGPWQGSPWRMLQITWDEPEVLQNATRISPWQVELVATTPLLQAPFPSTKKLKVSQNPELLPDGEGPLFFPLIGLTNSRMGHLSPSLFNFNFPAGMQGARHDPIYVSTLSNLVTNDSHPTIYNDHLYGNNVGPKLSPVSTDLNIGSTSQSDNSPHSQGSVHFFGTELFGNRICNSTPKAVVSSFQLFGKIIQTTQPCEGGGFGSKEYNEAEGVTDARDPSSYRYKRLYKRLDAQCPGVAVVEACSL